MNKDRVGQFAAILRFIFYYFPTRLRIHSYDSLIANQIVVFFKCCNSCNFLDFKFERKFSSLKFNRTFFGQVFGKGCRPQIVEHLFWHVCTLFRKKNFSKM